MTLAIEVDGKKLTLNKRSFKKYVQRNLSKIETTDPKKQKEKLSSKKALEFFNRLKGGDAAAFAKKSDGNKKSVSNNCGCDSKVVLKHFPEGFGTDTSKIYVGSRPKSADNQTSSFDYLVKILIVGKQGSGINRLLRLIQTGSFEKKSEEGGFICHTSSCRKQNQSESEEKVVKFQFSSQTNTYLTQANFRGCHAVVLPFDLTKPLNDSLQLKQLDQLITEVRGCGENDIKIVLVGTKVDTLENDPNAKDKLIALEKLAKTKNFYYCATSAVDENGQEQFLKLLTQVTALELLE